MKPHFRLIANQSDSTSDNMLKEENGDSRPESCLCRNERLADPSGQQSRLARAMHLNNLEAQEHTQHRSQKAKERQDGRKRAYELEITAKSCCLGIYVCAERTATSDDRILKIQAR
jgi:hypothetical protein